MKKIVVLFLLTFGVLNCFATNTWNLRAIAERSGSNLNLLNENNELFKSVSVEGARNIVEIFDRMAILTSIRPKILINDQNTFNAFVYPVGDNFVVQITYPMFEVISKDKDMASYLIGHELAHAYLKHREKKRQQQQSTEAINMVASIFLEILFQRKIGVIGLGSDIASIGTEASLASYSRDFEREADRQGALWASSLGYSLDGQVRMFEFLQSKSGDINSIFSTHPAPRERIEAAKEFAIENRLATSKFYAIEKPSKEQIELQKMVEKYKVSTLPKTEIGKMAIEEFSKRNFEKAYELNVRCEEQKDISCTNILGLMHEYGLGVRKDISKALEKYKIGIAENYGPSVINFYRLNLTGFSGPIVEEDAFKYYSELAKQGSIDAMGALASMSANKEYLTKTKEMYLSKRTSNLPNSLMCIVFWESTLRSS